MAPTITVGIGTWLASVGPVPVVDAAGTEWILTSLDGWFAGVGIRAATVDYLQGDGSMTGPVRLSARTITVLGSAVALDEAGLLAAMDELDALLTGATRTALFIVDEAGRGVHRQCSVHLAGPTMCKRTGPISLDFSLSLLAPDPTRYPVPA